MKSFGSLILALVLLGASAPSKDTTLTVTGEASVSRPADTATISLEIVTNNATANIAATENNGRYNDLRNRLHGIGIADDAIRTLSYAIAFVANADEGPRPGYTVTRRVSVTLTKLDLVGRAVDQAVGAGVSNVDNVGYSIANYREIYAQALKAALGDAALQAKALASAAGLKIVRIATIQAGGSYGPPVLMRATQAMALPSIPTEIVSGPLDVHATVTVSYILAP